MATVTNYPIDLPILVIEAQIFVAVKKFQFLPNKLIPTTQSPTVMLWIEIESTRIIIHNNIHAFGQFILISKVM